MVAKHEEQVNNANEHHDPTQLGLAAFDHGLRGLMQLALRSGEARL
jgi:recombinational DNA repair protein RecT